MPINESTALAMPTPFTVQRLYTVPPGGHVRPLKQPSMVEERTGRADARKRRIEQVHAVDAQVCDVVQLRRYQL